MSTIQRFIELNKILEKLGIKNAQDYMHKVILNDGDNIEKLVSISKELNGGMMNEKKESKNTMIKYHNVDFNFSSLHKGKNVYYHLSGNSTTCITIIINKDEQIANLYEINYNPTCFPKEIKEEFMSGTTILNLALKLIEKVKAEYNIKFITLKDNSSRECHNTDGNRIAFSKMMTLIEGETWYGKYGFRPYNGTDQNMSKKMYEAYRKNKKIMETTKMKNVSDLKKMYFKAIEKAKKKVKVTETMEKNIIDLFDDYYNEDVLVKDFLSDLLEKKIFIGDAEKKVAGTCLVFFYFYNDLYEKLGLYDFQGKSFMKRI
jgi:hypothetical protein